MVEIKFPAKLRNGGKVKIFTVPFEVLDFYGLTESEVYEVTIRKKEQVNEQSGIQSRDLIRFTAKLQELPI